MPAKHDQMRNTNTLLILEHIRKHGGSTRTTWSWVAGLTLACGDSAISAAAIDINNFFIVLS